MTVVGCTGHQALSDETQRSVAGALFERLASLSPSHLEGVCSLAVGADQIFAAVLLETGGQLHVVIPCANYESTFDTEGRVRYADLLSRSTSSETLAFPSPTEEAFMAAGRAVADRADLLLAVWDGAPAAGQGGTADVVGYAKDCGKNVEVIWPAGARRA